jgi:hypothetical protein
MDIDIAANDADTFPMKQRIDELELAVFRST